LLSPTVRTNSAGGLINALHPSLHVPCLFPFGLTNSVFLDETVKYFFLAY
jgi:hypothetical protein